jgi:Ras GTPase-activating protein 1
MLKQHCRAQFSRAQSKVPNLRELRCLNLQILEAHRIPFKLVPHCFVTVALNKIKIAKTKVKSTPDPIFEEEYVIDDLPIDIQTLNLTLVSRAKRNKESDVAELTIDLSTLKNGSETENWYDLVGITPIAEWGSIRCRIRYMDDLVMPEDEYSPLQELLLENEFHSVRALADLCHTNRVPFASSLLKIFRHERKECELIKSLCQAEIARETDVATLFRATSLATTLMDIYMRSECGLFLQSALSDTIQKLLESKQSAELNPTKMEVNDDACTNAEFLVRIIFQLLLQTLIFIFCSC